MSTKRFALTLLSAILFWAVPSGAALSVVQATPVIDGQNLSPSVTLTFPSSVTATDLIFLVIGATNDTVVYADPTSGPSDGLGNSYTKIRGDDQNGDFGSEMWTGTWYAKNITGGSCTITATFAVNIGNGWAQAIEVSGADTGSPLDNSTVGLGNSATPSVTLTTTASSTIVFETLSGSLFAGTATKGASFTLDGNFPTSVAITGHKIVSSSGGQTVNGTLGSADQYLLQGIAFKAASGPPASSPAIFFSSSN